MTSSVPKKKKKKRRSDGLATRKRICTHATTLFASQGYNATSLRSIAAATGIDIATLKYHYKEKSALFAQVYAQGYERFAMALLPSLTALDAATDAADVHQGLIRLSKDMHAYAQQDLEFIRLTMFRMLEDEVEFIQEEDSLQVIAISVMEARFESLAERGIIKPVDARGMAVFLIASFGMWNVTARTKESWLGPPHISTPEGLARSEEFFTTFVSRTFGGGPSLGAQSLGKARVRDKGGWGAFKTVRALLP